MKKIKHRGFTDKLYFANLIFTWVFTYVCVILSCLGGLLGIEDYSFVSVGLPIVWAELGIHTGFIIWKAKAENIHKWGDSNNIMM